MFDLSVLLIHEKSNVVFLLSDNSKIMLLLNQKSLQVLCFYCWIVI